MQVQWIFWFSLLGLVYVSSGNTCDSEHAAPCYADLVHYESLAFPLYGESAIKLDETCGNINMSFECLESYMETCTQNPECDKECQDLILDAHEFSRNTGLRRLASELCGEHSAVRTVYLDNVPCLEENADSYAACHNDSQMSQEYMNTLTQVDIIIPSRCCFFTWYHDCFTNVTRDRCGENARFFVSFAMHKLVGHVADQLCESTNVSCRRPPLPPDTDDTGDLDKDKPDQTANDVDNAINDMPKDSATMTSCVVGLMVLSYSVIVMSKLFL